VSIENTAHRDPALHLLGSLSDGTSYIEGMEAAGQRQLVASTSLPVEANDGDAAFEALGFVLGKPDPRDPLFREAKLPEGWGKEGSDHNMWSYIVDQLGRRRVAVFYKAAFYDRRAFMRLETLHGYAYNLAYDDNLPVYDDQWCTPEAFAEEVAASRADLVKRLADAERFKVERPDDKFWPSHASQLTDELAKHDAWAARVAAAAPANPTPTSEKD